MICPECKSLDVEHYETARVKCNACQHTAHVARFRLTVIQPVDVTYCRNRFHQMSVDDGEPISPDYPWFWMSYWYEGDLPGEAPTNNTDIQLAELVRLHAASGGHDLTTKAGLEETLRGMYYG